MPNPAARLTLDTARTPWHITFGTYGTRLNGDSRPTVEKQHDRRGEPFVAPDADRTGAERQQMRFPARYLTLEQRTFAEAELPSICRRGAWTYRAGAAESDHLHLLCDVAADVHGEKVRRLVKRWLGQALSKRWPLASGVSWWAEEGSNIAIHDEAYLNNAYRYIMRQRTTDSEKMPGRPRPRQLHINIFSKSQSEFFSLTWETAAEALQALPRLDLEPDGFFVWSGEAEGERWHVSGQLFDFDDRLHRVQLHGACPTLELDQLLSCFGWPGEQLVFELVREGLVLNEAEFRERIF